MNDLAISLKEVRELLLKRDCNTKEDCFYLYVLLNSCREYSGSNPLVDDPNPRNDNNGKIDPECLLHESLITTLQWDYQRYRNALDILEAVGLICVLSNPDRIFINYIR